MAVLKILTAPNEILSKPAAPVTDVTAVQGVIDDMLDTLYSTDDGIGLAAPQIGSSLAIVVIDLSETRDDPLILINPEILPGEETVLGPEACLSVPGYSADVERYTKVKVKALNRQGEEIIVESDDFLAIVMQHETDHLKGTLFIDYLSPLKKQMALKKVKKYVKSVA